MRTTPGVAHARPMVALVALLFVLTALPALAQDPPSTSAALWDEVDITPMPRQMALTGRAIPLGGDQGGATIVLGEAPCRQSEIGADWVNRRLVELGGEVAAVVRGTPAAPRKLAIVIGTRADNELVAAALREGNVSVSPGNPGPQGYEIRSSADGHVAYLAGADPVGALYACVTFAELLESRGGQVAWRQAEVRDWPDFQHRPLGGGWTGSTSVPEIQTLYVEGFWSKPTPEFRERYLGAMRAHYDRLLRWKVSCLELAGRWWWYRKSSPENRALVREATEYGRERGIGLLIYAAEPFVALAEDHPEVIRSCLPAAGSDQWAPWIRCWSMDDLRKETAGRLAQFANDVGATDVCFHDTDTGGYDNPAQWNQRCDVCRQRWGDDYGAATAHIHRIYYDALKSAVPDIRVHAIVYPYTISILDPRLGGTYATWYDLTMDGLYDPANRTRYEVLMQRLARELPEDVTFGLREERLETVQRFRELIRPHGAFADYQLLGDVAWESFFSEAPRWTGTFYGDPRDFLRMPIQHEMFVPLQALAGVEYAWNTRAPGAAPYARLMECDQWRHSEPSGEVYSIVLPHIVRGLFGRQAASEITRAASRNIDPRRIFDRVEPWVSRRLTDARSMKQQADLATDGAQALDAVWSRCQESNSRLGMSDYAFRRFVYLREVFHGCQWMARARAEDLLARELAIDQDRAGADAAVERGLAAVTAGKADLQRLPTERPVDPVLATPGMNAWADSWREFMADRADLAPAAQTLEQTRTDLPRLGPVPGPTLECLVGRRMLRAVRADGPITVDGALDEPPWARAYPVETFTVDGQESRVAVAHTRMRLLYDEPYLYLGLSCWPPQAQATQPGGALLTAVQPDDMVEALFRPSEWGDDCLYIAADAAGNVTCQRGRVIGEGGDVRWQPQAAWSSPGLLAKVANANATWNAEVAIPWSSLQGTKAGSAWAGGCFRTCPVGKDATERSSTQSPQAKSRYDSAAFRGVMWCADQRHHPAISIEVTEAATRTGDPHQEGERVVEFGVEVGANQVLHDAKLRAEAYGSDGRLQKEEALFARERIWYDWRAPGRCSVELRPPCDSSGVRLVLESAEGSAERWLRFGGWQGVGGASSVFGPGSAATAPAGDFRATPCLRDAAHFPSVLRLPTGRQAKLFEAPHGTVEFWVRPGWQGAWPPGGNRSEHNRLANGLLHFGVLWPWQPELTHYDSVSLVHDDPSGGLFFSIASYNHVGWTSSADLRSEETWRPGTWHHVACVWDATAAPSDWLRIYLDGKAAGGATQLSHPEQWPGEDKSPRVRNDAPFVVQVGCLNSGRGPADAWFDELRISRTARYAGDFVPAAAELALDRDTSALFHFNGSLEGEGLTPEGDRYDIMSTAGVFEYR